MDDIELLMIETAERDKKLAALGKTVEEWHNRLNAKINEAGRPVPVEKMAAIKEELMEEMRAESEVTLTVGELPCEGESADDTPENEEIESESADELMRQPEPKENAWKQLNVRAARYQKQLQKVSAEIAEKEDVVDDLKEQLKVARSELKACNKELLRLARNGMSEQLELDLPDTEQSEPKESDEGENREEDEEPSEEWKKRPVSDLDLTEKIKEKLAENFGNCGEVCDWIGSDYVNKIKGLGEFARDKIRDAIDKMAGVTEKAIRKEAAKKSTEKTALEKETLLAMPDDENSVERDPCKVEAFLDKIEELILQDEYFYANDTLEGIYEWVDKNNVYTKAQESAVENIANAPAQIEED
ncbi:MAG: hypothetical protein Q4D62_11390 [Planctomycetia bacterium]|nr:hypothetical protein [Planctomycetia bacterium]